jgi:multiple sugar transport system substrate-binding protein
MHRHIGVLVALFAVMALLTACAVPVAAPEAGAGGEGAEAPVTLSFLSRNPNQAQVQMLVAAWNEAHPEIQIEATFVPTDQFVTKLGTMIAGGTPPDITAIDLVFGPQFAAAGQLSDITELATALPYFDQLSPSHVRLATFEDGIYGLPFNAEASILMWNKNLFEEAGLDPEQPPTTWAEIADYAEQINALGDDTYGYYFSGNCAGCNAFTFMPLIWASGGDILSEDGTTATMTDPVVKEALQFYRDLWEAGVIPPDANTDTGPNFLTRFAGGNIGMQGLGAFALAATRDNPDIEFGVTYLPGKDGGTSSFAGGDLIAIPAGSQYVDEAFQFLEWMTSDDVQLNLYAKEFSLPVRTDLADNEYFEEDPRYTLNTNAMGLGRTPYTVHYNELYNDPNGPWLAMLQTAIFEGNIDEAIATAQEKMTEILAQE